MTKWESEKHKRWRMPSEGFKGHVATDGSLLGSAGKWRACRWAVVQLDYDEEMGPLHGMYGSMEAALEVQRTNNRADLTAFLCLLKKVTGPIKVHVDNKGIIDGLWRGERECSRNEKRCTQPCSMHCLVEEWKVCDELKPKPKEKWIFVDQRKRSIERSGVQKRKSIDA